MHPRLLAFLTALLVITGVAGVVFTVTDDDGDGRLDRVVVELVPAAVAVDGSDKNATPDRSIELDGEAREVVKQVAKDPEAHDFGPGLRGDDRTPIAEHEGPLATPNFPGCETRILPTNWSNRVVAMSEVDGIGLHYTAGFNRAGKSDMDGLTGFASSPSAGVSWHFLIDAEGHCYYQVPLGKKAWTIGNLNSETVNIEVIGRGNEPSYPASAAGAAKLRQVVRELGRRLDIPMRVGSVSNCHVTVPGIVTHWQGGVCAGGHIDIKPYELASVVKAIAGCDARCKQQLVVSGRVAKHADTHRTYRERGCRRRFKMHEPPLRTVRRAKCRELKLRGRRQHAGIRRARAKLGSL